MRFGPAKINSHAAVRFEIAADKHELVLSQLDKLDEPALLVVASMLLRVDLPELILEIAARTRFTDAFTHISERTARATDQFSELNDITVPGTLRDSLSLLAVVLEQQTDLQPTQSMTDTGAYSDVVFGLFRARLPLQPASG